jgi:murein DD-endopeptidase MepM/ murein hydrolase activator NlpD
MVDLLDYMRGDVGPDGVNGKPVGVKHQPGEDGIYQVQRDGKNSRRWFQVKGAWNNPPPQCDWEELWHDDTYVYRAIDTSRKASEGGPYTLYDTEAQRGSKWIKRNMDVGETFFRNPTVAAFDMATGVRKKVEGQAPTWIKLAAIHPRWQGIADVAELHWLLNQSAGSPTERYFYAKGLGLVGFTGSGMTTTPNSVFPNFPPATGIPVLVRKPATWLPAMPAEPAPLPADGWYLLNPCHSFRYFIWDNFGNRRTPETNDGDKEEYHPAIDITFATGEVAPYPVVAAQAGRVVASGWDDTGFGNRVKIDHGNGRTTLYGHMESIDAGITVGTQVIIGQRLGNMGTTGRSTGPHLHFEYRVDGIAYDPRPLMRDTIAAPEQPPVVVPPSEPPTTPPIVVVPQPPPVVAHPIGELPKKVQDALDAWYTAGIAYKQASDALEAAYAEYLALKQETSSTLGEAA